MNHLLIKIMMMVILMGGLAMGQNAVPVAPGEGTLSAAIAAAADGDILLLIPDALYTESVANNLGAVINKKITIAVDGDGSIKAKVQILTPSTSETVTHFFNVGDKGSLTLFGLQLDGGINDIASASYLIRCYMGETPATTNIKTLRIDNCEIKNLKSNVIDAGPTNLAGYAVVDSTIIDNCIVTNTGTSVYYKYAGSNFIQVTNSTFNTINSYGMRISGCGYTTLADNTPTVIIDHTTWYNCGLSDPREIILSDKGLPTYFLNPWTVSNSIFVKMTGKDKTVINIKETLNNNMAAISSICMWDVGKKAWLQHTVKDTITMDPGFKDPEHGDFTLPERSILQNFGTDKKPIGDPRWGHPSASAVADRSLQPEQFVLSQNYPNPFNPNTEISFVLPNRALTTLRVYDALGRQVAVLAQDLLSAGVHHYQFNAQNLPSGLYIYHLTSCGQTLTKKMLLLK